MSELELYKGMVKKMKDEEIKEILEQCDGVVKRKIPLLILAPVYTKILLDYITNLQQKEELFEKIVYKYDELKQENERLKEKSINEVLKIDFDMCVKDLKKANKKIEKANEIAKDLKQFVYDELVDRNVSGATETHDKIINLLNTLNGKE